MGTGEQMHTRKITFDHESGHRLPALLDLPVDDEPIAYALFADRCPVRRTLKNPAEITTTLAR